MSRIAIIGGGMSGITAALQLAEKAEVVLFDKSRGVSGRMSTRRTDDFEFDHGAQYFTIKDPRFQSAVTDAVKAGHVAQWRGIGLYSKDDGLETDNGNARYVGTPRMNSWIKWMAEDAVAKGVEIHLSKRAQSLSRNKDTWSIDFEDETQDRGFDWVIMAAPSPQVSVIFPQDFSERETLDTVKMDACYALMLGLNNRPDVAWDTLRSPDGPTSWMAVNSVKPGRPDAPTLMVHAGPAWSNARIDGDRARVEQDMLAQTLSKTGLSTDDIAYTTLHGWRYAAVSHGAGQACLIDTSQRLIAAGDWCLGGRVEGAYLSGLAAADAVLNAG